MFEGALGVKPLQIMSCIVIVSCVGITLHVFPEVCPMAGLRAPELVGGALEEIFESSWDMNIAHWSVADIPGLRPLQPDEVELVAAGFAAAKAHLLFELQAKLDWRLRLPWSLIGLARLFIYFVREFSQL